MSNNIKVSVIYFNDTDKCETEKYINNQSIGSGSVEIVKMQPCSFKESLTAWQDVYSSLKGKYVTVVYEGDVFGKNYFENMIADMEKYKVSVSVPNSVYLYDTKNNLTKPADAVELCRAKDGTCFINDMNGVLWEKSCLIVDDHIDLGWETQKYYLLDMLLNEKKWIKANHVKYRYAEAKDDNFQFFPGMTDIDWYYSSINDFLIPYLKNAEKKYGTVPDMLQIFTIYFLCCRLYANLDNRNKHLIEGGDIEEYVKLWHEILGFVDNKTILRSESVPSVKINFNIRKMLLQIKEWDFELKFDIINNASTLFLVFENYLIMSAKSLVVNITLIDYKDGALHIDFSVPSYFDNKTVRFFADIDGTEYDVKFDERYSLTKYFGKSAYKSYGGRAAVPLNEKSSFQRISFCIEYNGVKQPLKLSFQSHTSRISKKPLYAYWNVANYTVYHSNDTIVVRKKRKLYTLYREIRCLAEMLFSRSKPVYVLLLMRLAYWITRPFYRKKTVWMFYDKLYKGGDSSEYLYKYAIRQNDNIKKYYILDKKSADYKRMRREGYKPVKRNSPKHYLTFFNASMMVVSNSTVFAFHNLPLAYSSYMRGIVDFHVCCVQHGLSVQKIAIAQRRLRDNTRLYFCASKYEIDNLSKPQYNYEGTNALRITGIPRYDGLINDDKKQILIVPTWRMQSALLVSRNEGVARDYNPNFKETEYFKIYNGLINNDRLIAEAKKYGYRIHYVLHPIVSPQAEDFDKNDYVDIIPSIGDMSYEKEFSESSLMVTDFSGIQFDFAYMRKPLVYLHHYKIPQHYEEGTFHYDTMAFGEICTDEDQLIDLLIEYMKNGCVMKDMYRKRADDFFVYNDVNNCQRVYDDMLEYQNIINKSDNSCI
ncbi:MAG: CDP-glycerol glycerophosphotransferase family protein [Clostridium sp.]|nr:CDP-glycerol glycerophosphotransferase family protein [Clostridium sp.]MCM1547041.1 CDP-glycerol glycerophosphotransferase family protein [Ruminococcus sp.]